MSGYQLVNGKRLCSWPWINAHGTGDHPSRFQVLSSGLGNVCVLTRFCHNPALNVAAATGESPGTNRLLLKECVLRDRCEHVVKRKARVAKAGRCHSGCSAHCKPRTYRSVYLLAQFN